MKKCCPRNTRSTPMKQNLRDKAFVPFVCLVRKPLLPNLRAFRGHHAYLSARRTSTTITLFTASSSQYMVWIA